MELHMGLVGPHSFACVRVEPVRAEDGQEVAIKAESTRGRGGKTSVSGSIIRPCHFADVKHTTPPLV